VKKLYRYILTILDDGEFSDDEMRSNVLDALEIHTEAIGVKLVTLEVSRVEIKSSTKGEVPEA
jgi:hypothetical protein